MKPTELKALIDIVAEIVELRRHAAEGRDVVLRMRAEPNGGHKWLTIDTDVLPPDRGDGGNVTIMLRRIEEERRALPEGSFGRAVLDWYEDSKIIGLRRILENNPSTLKVAREVGEIAARMFGSPKATLTEDDAKVIDSLIDLVEPMTLGRDMETLAKGRKLLRSAVGKGADDIFSLIRERH